MNPRAPKRNICRYFAASGSCFYGDQCQFQHVRGNSSAGVGSTSPPSQNLAPRKLPGHIRAPLTDTANKRSVSYHSHSQPQNPMRYRHPFLQTASNPPKHRTSASTSNSMMSSRSGPLQSSPSRSQSSPLPPTKLHPHSQPMKAVGPQGAAGRISSLQPPPPSKQSKMKSAQRMSAAQTQVESGGTTYFYSSTQQPSYMSSYSKFTKPSTHLARAAAMRAPSYFVGEALHQDILQRQAMCLTVPSEGDSCPTEVDNYHSLCPLEPIDITTPDQESKRTFDHASTCYRAVSTKDGLYYCLRRIHGFRLTSGKAVLELEKWRKLEEHTNLISLREMFTTKAFGDNSVVFVYDYHPGAESLRAKHLKHTKRLSPLPEDLVWEYLTQLVCALRVVHGSNLALRCVDPSKVLLTSRCRLRINCAGIMDILNFDNSGPSPPVTLHQQEDLMSLGQLMLCVCLQSVTAANPDSFHNSLELISMRYSPDLHHIIQYLLQSGSKGPPHSIVDVSSMVGGRVYSTLETSYKEADLLEGELSKEIQNGRLFKLLAKLGTVTERPEFGGDSQWSETGDRYLLKLFKDYLFHQVLPSGTPWVDLAHIIQTLNKLDAGSPENIALHSRDEQSILVVSYADLKSCLQTAFTDVLTSSTTHTSTPNNHANR